MGTTPCIPDLLNSQRVIDCSNNPNLSTPSCKICLVASALTLGLTMWNALANERLRSVMQEEI